MELLKSVVSLTLNALSLAVFCQIFAQEISDFPLPDLARVAEHSDPVELGRLLQLVLGCAVRCERKQGLCLFVCCAVCVHKVDTCRYSYLQYTCGVQQVEGRTVSQNFFFVILLTRYGKSRALRGNRCRQCYCIFGSETHE